MVCPERLVGIIAAAFGLGVLIGGLLPCLGLGLIAVGVIIIRL